MTKLRKIWLLVTFISFVIMPTLTSRYIASTRNQELFDSELETANNLLAKGNEDGAISVYEFLTTHGLDNDGLAMASYTHLIAQRNQISSKISNTIKGGLNGFLFGEVKDPASLGGCVAGDLIVWGDIRDLMKNAYVKAKGGEVDEITVALSTIGLATSLAPHIDIGISVIKNMAKCMSKTLRAGLKILIDEAVLTKNIDKLSKFLSNLGSSYKQIGMGTLDLIQFSKDSKALMRLAEIVNKYGKPAYGAIMVGGRGAIRVFETAADYGLKLTGSAGKRVVRFGVKYPQLAVRFIKIGKKVGIDYLDVTLIAVAELLLMLSWKTLVFIGFAIWIWCFWLEAGTLFVSIFRKPEYR